MGFAGAAQPWMQAENSEDAGAELQLWARHDAWSLRRLHALLNLTWEAQMAQRLMGPRIDEMSEEKTIDQSSLQLPGLLSRAILQSSWFLLAA